MDNGKITRFELARAALGLSPAQVIDVAYPPPACLERDTLAAARDVLIRRPMGTKAEIRAAKLAVAAHKKTCEACLEYEQQRKRHVRVLSVLETGRGYKKTNLDLVIRLCRVVSHDPAPALAEVVCVCGKRRMPSFADIRPCACKARQCLKCDTKFMSANAGCRMCGPCSSSSGSDWGHV